MRASRHRRAYLRKYQRDWIARRRAEWIAANGPCRKCGSTTDLQVDHLDPSKKVDHRVWSWSAQRRWAELAKCQVLCGVCHRQKTRIELLSKASCGTRNRYRHGCRCESCCQANRDYAAQHRVGTYPRKKRAPGPLVFPANDRLGWLRQRYLQKYGGAA